MVLDQRHRKCPRSEQATETKANGVGEANGRRLEEQEAGPGGGSGAQPASSKRGRPGRRRCSEPPVP